jgi:hypothetical protein
MSSSNSGSAATPTIIASSIARQPVHEKYRQQYSSASGAPHNLSFSSRVSDCLPQDAVSVSDFSNEGGQRLLCRMVSPDSSPSPSPTGSPLFFSHIPSGMRIHDQTTGNMVSTPLHVLSCHVPVFILPPSIPYALRILPPSYVLCFMYHHILLCFLLRILNGSLELNLGFWTMSLYYVCCKRCSIQ